MTASPLKIGFVGLGIMGAPMAGHLARAGHPLYVHTLGKLPGEIAETTAVPCLNGRDVAERSDIVFIMVPDTPDVESALFAQHGIAAGLAEGKTVVDMSSISPIATKRFAEKIRALGCDYLDAPVSGGEVGARNATLSIMAGGDEAVFARVKPLFELMGKNITLVGGNGDGQTAKVANQIIVALNIQAVAEALLFAARAGADPARVRQALMGGFASSKILEVHGERMIKRSFDPGFRIELHQKDLNLALSSARAGRVAAQHRHDPGNVQRLRARQGLGSFGAGARTGAAGQFRDRPAGLSHAQSRRPAAPHVRRHGRLRPAGALRGRATARTGHAARRPRHRHRRRQGLGGDGPGGRIPLGRALTGLVVTRHGYAAPCARIEIVEAAHPVPDEAGLRAARRMLDLVSGLRPEDTVLCLISGGGSALLPLPLDGLTLRDKQAVNRRCWPAARPSAR